MFRRRTLITTVNKTVNDSFNALLGHNYLALKLVDNTIYIVSITQAQLFTIRGNNFQLVFVALSCTGNISLLTTSMTDNSDNYVSFCSEQLFHLSHNS